MAFTSFNSFQVLLKSKQRVSNAVSDVISRANLKYYFTFNSDYNNSSTGTAVAAPGFSAANNPVIVSTNNGGTYSSGSLSITNTGVYTSSVIATYPSMQYISFLNSTNPLNVSNGVTICYWIYFNNSPNNNIGSNMQTIITMGNTTTPNSSAGNAWLEYSMSSTIGNGASSIGGNLGTIGSYYPTDSSNNTIVLTNGIWYHIAYVCNTTIVYINGKAGTQVGNYSFGQSGNAASGIYPLYFGASTYNQWGKPFNGYIEHLRVYERNLTSAEIGVLYTNKC
jgi:hypothetical protein